MGRLYANAILIPRLLPVWERLWRSVKYLLHARRAERKLVNGACGRTRGPGVWCGEPSYHVKSLRRFFDLAMWQERVCVRVTSRYRVWRALIGCG